MVKRHQPDLRIDLAFNEVIGAIPYPTMLPLHLDEGERGLVLH